MALQRIYVGVCWSTMKVNRRQPTPFSPWKLIYYSAFEDENTAKDFEKYLKTGSGKAFAYKRLLKIEKFKK